MEIIRNLIHSDLALIKDFRDKMISFLQTMDYDEDLIFKIKLIFDELVINSYKHGNCEDYEKLIDIILFLDRNLVVIKVKDEGEGIHYGKDRDLLSDHGRGIQLVYTLADHLLVKDNTIVAMIDISN